MNITRVERRWMLLLVAANALFWVWFWTYFFSHPTLPTPQPIWEGGTSWAKALGRDFGDGGSLTAFRTPMARAAMIMFLPCVLLTWPIPRLAPAGFEFAGFDAQGMRLVLITALSFVQWVMVIRLLSASIARFVKHR